MSSLCTRLERQLVLLQQREADMLDANRKLLEEVAQKDTTSKKIENATEAKQKLDGMWDKVKAQYANLDKMREVELEEDRELRKELAVDLQRKLSSMNDNIEAVTAKRANAIKDNDELKRKIDIITKGSTDREKIKAIFDQQEKDIENAQAKMAAEKEAIPVIKKQVEELHDMYEKLKAECDPIEKEVAEHSKDFGKVQESVLGATKAIKEQENARNKLTPKVEAAQREMLDAEKRAQRAIKDRDQEMATLEKLSQQHAALVAATEKLRNLTEVLANQEQGKKHVDPTAA